MSDDGVVVTDPSRAARDARLAWIIGGAMLIAHAALTLVADFAPGLRLPGGRLTLGALWAAALLIFALGIRGSGSVVARRWDGVSALVVAAAMPLVVGVLSLVI